MNRLILRLVLLAVAVAVVVAECPRGYTQRPGGYCYKVWKQKRKWWYYADRTCKEEGAFLVSIRSRSELDWVSNFYSRNRGGGDRCGDWYWIGTNDISRERHWVFTESGEGARYFNWKRKQPDNHRKAIWRKWRVRWKNEDVVQVDRRSKQWNDETRDIQAQCFVCQIYPRSK